MKLDNSSANSSRVEVYESTLQQLESLLDGESDPIANMANAAALLKLNFPTFSWVGFYLLRRDELVLGPFQGKPACVRIRLGEGVCGTAAAKKETVIVEDVAKFPGHIVCDPEAKSEIVVPLEVNGETFGVLDVDSTLLSHFDIVDRIYLEKAANLLSQNLNRDVRISGGGDP